jgi:hypothetical protein
MMFEEDEHVDEHIIEYCVETCYDSVKEEEGFCEGDECIDEECYNKCLKSFS